MTFQRRKHYYTRKECKKANGCNHTLVREWVVLAVSVFCAMNAGNILPESMLCYPQRVPTGERPYERSEIGKSFTISIALHYHQSFHHSKPLNLQ